MFDRLRRWQDDQRAAAQRRLDKLDAKARERKAQQGDAVADELRGYVAAHEGELVARCGQVFLFPDRVIKLPATGWTVPIGDPSRGVTPECQPVAGVSASVEQVGAVSARSTLARTAVPGAHGWQKKVDDREVYLVVDGPEFQWQVKLGDGAAAPEVRQFAALVTTAGRKAASA